MPLSARVVVWGTGIVPDAYNLEAAPKSYKVHVVFHIFFDGMAPTTPTVKVGRSAGTRDDQLQVLAERTLYKSSWVQGHPRNFCAIGRLDLPTSEI